MTRYKSRDGLMQSTDPANVALWDDICAKHADEQARWNALLRAKSVKLAHPDDGWVHPSLPLAERRDGKLGLSWYPRFNDNPQVGDLIALGAPSQTGVSWDYRLVRVTRIERGQRFIDWTDYHFEDTGIRLPEPKPTFRQRLVRGLTRREVTS